MRVLYILKKIEKESTYFYSCSRDYILSNTFFYIPIEDKGECEYDACDSVTPQGDRGLA